MTLQRTCDIRQRAVLRQPSTVNEAISRRTFIQEGNPDKWTNVRIIVQESKSPFLHSNVRIPDKI